MGLRELTLANSYDTGNSDVDVVMGFLEPCLEESIQYDRLSGYFSSKVLSLAARGLGGFLAGQGKMRLITSANLTQQDLDAITGMNNDIHVTDSLAILFEKALSDRFALESLIEQRHLEAMCWLVKHERLEIRVVIPRNATHATNSIFHSKVGVFSDLLNDTISFSGSVNETVYGWTHNIEEFKVFKSWDPATAEFVKHDKALFDKYWNPAPDASFRTMALPEATRMHLISLSPSDAPDLGYRSISNATRRKSHPLRDYQVDAVNAWAANNHLGLFEMATGTGKTKTAAACVKKVQSIGPSLTVITAPYQHIAMQWVNELADMKPILASGASDWKALIREAISRRALNRIQHIVVVAVQNTAASTAFLEATNAAAKTTNNFLFVGDEVHGLGAVAFQNALNPMANFRLGLSATPNRYFDEVGTEYLLEYFKGCHFEFGTTRALTWIDPLTGQTPLCPYEYHPVFVSLSDDELTAYEKLSEKILKLSDSEDSDKKALLEKLLFKRAGILKKAGSKIPALEKLLGSFNFKISNALIYCNDFDQLLDVARVLDSHGITFQKITGDEQTSPSDEFAGRSEREWILENFARGESQVLLAIKCLDEGVDIPSAEMGLILASSGNPREFIQRRGRLMRRYPGKTKASIYDFVVAPSPDARASVSGSGQDTSIFKRELKRIDEFSKDALNRTQLQIKITTKLGELI
jgi:superfamily II DNA or RNA helicase